MPTRHQQIQETSSDRAQSGYSICVAKKLCPRGDLPAYDTGCDPASGSLKASHAVRPNVVFGAFDRGG
jgi:hypothetical protein